MNKLLLIVIVAVLAIGGFMVLGTKKESPVVPSPQPEEIATPTQTQPEEKVTTVTLTDTGYTPKDITVKVGTKVTWINSSGKDAIVNSGNHPTHLLYPFLNLGKFADGEKLEVTVDKAGKYSYHNHLNASQTGTITVE